MVALAAVKDWAPAASAGLAAVAALASWVAVRQTHRDSIAARRPDLEIRVIEGLDTGVIKVHIHNHGRGAARGVKFVVAEGDEAIYGFLPPDATLPPGQSRTLLTPMQPSRERESTAVVICHDGDGDAHGWNAAGRHKKWKLNRPWNRKLNDEKIAQSFYPSLDPFSMTLMRYEVEK